MALAQNDIVRLTKAMNFAAQKHIHQRRKGESAEPYINHTLEVGHLLSEHTDGKDIDLIIGGILHDTIEDTNTTKEELILEFGQNVADIVSECTDDKTLPKAERKHLQVENAPHKSTRARQIKIADKISNLRSILSSPPPDWSNARKLEYFEWSKKVVDGCRGINTGLEQEYDRLYQIGAAKFKLAA